MPENYYPFELIPLNYPYNALEPYIDTETMRVHHNGHLRTYVDNLNQTLSQYPTLQTYSLTQLLKNLRFLPDDVRTSIRRNGGGVYNHNLYFKGMAPADTTSQPKGMLLDEIKRQFGSFAQMKKELTDEGLSVFGSGYAYLVKSPTGKLLIVSTKNQDTPLTYNLSPILILDVWEHAYYLKNQNRREDYINFWWQVVDWDQAERLMAL